MIYLDLLAALNNAGVRYLVAGGVAVNLHGYARFTVDLDLLLLLEEDNIRAALEVFGAQGYVPRAPVPAGKLADPEKRRAMRQEKGALVFTFVHGGNPLLHVDVFLDEPLDVRAAWERRAVVDVGGVAVLALSLDDLAAVKRAAGRERDLADAAELEKLADLRRRGVLP